jgi:hypothetical protein
MNWLTPILLLTLTFAVVYGETAFDLTRNLFAVQIDFLPAVVVCTALFSNLPSLCLVATCGGLWLDSLSANPLGVSVLPLFGAGFIIFCQRDLVLREQPYAQFILGLSASAGVPAATLLFIYTAGGNPLIGRTSLWQWLVMALGGAAATPLLAHLFRWLTQRFNYQVAPQSSFRPDREIKRGRA